MNANRFSCELFQLQKPQLMRGKLSFCNTPRVWTTTYFYFSSMRPRLSTCKYGNFEVAFVGISKSFSFCAVCSATCTAPSSRTHELFSTHPGPALSQLAKLYTACHGAFSSSLLILLSPPLQLASSVFSLARSAKWLSQ